MNKLLWLVMILMWAAWSADYFYFRHAGPRFTAQQGQELCLRVQAMDGLPCEYSRNGQ